MTFVTEAIVLLVFPVITNILVLCGTSEMWWVLCEVVFTMQSRAFVRGVTPVGAGWVEAGGACGHIWYTITLHTVRQE